MAEKTEGLVWIGAKVGPDLFDHVEQLANRLGTTRSHIVRTVLRHTDMERVLGDLRREAEATGAGATTFTMYMASDSDKHPRTKLTG